MCLLYYCLWKTQLAVKSPSVTISISEKNIHKTEEGQKVEYLSFECFVF